MAWPSDFANGEVLSAARLNSVLGSIKAPGGFVDLSAFGIILAHAAPTDGDIPAGGVVVWVDEGTNALKFRCRYSNGTTLKTGTVSLT